MLSVDSKEKVSVWLALLAALPKGKHIVIFSFSCFPRVFSIQQEFSWVTNCSAQKYLQNDAT